MPTPDELETQFWKALRSDMTMMLGLAGVAEGHTRPMTAQLDGDARADLVLHLQRKRDWSASSAGASRAVATFASKGHDIFAAVHGKLSLDTDRAVVDRLWNRFVAAWFEGGKDDPKLRLLRLDPDEAEIWARRLEPRRRASSCCSAPIPKQDTRTTSPGCRLG